MDAAGPSATTTTPLARLAEHLRETGSSLSIDEALAAAIDDWLAAQAQRRSDSKDAGVQWKTLFLPHGTRLRMQHAGIDHHAQVEGDAIVYQGRRVTPRGLTVAVCGDGRNAWRDLLLKRPQDAVWQRPLVLRNALARASGASPKHRAHKLAADFSSDTLAPDALAPDALAPADPAVALASAAQALHDALSSAVTLVAHVKTFPPRGDQRRPHEVRRASDVLADICQQD